MWLWTGGCPPTPNVRLWFHRKMVSGTSSLKTLREEECLISSVPWKTNAERDLWYLKAVRTLKAIGKGLGVLSCCCAPSLSSSHEAALPQLWAARVCQCPAACAQGQSPQAGALVTNPQCLSLVDGTVPHRYVWSLVLQPPRSVAKIPSPPALQVPGLNAPQSSPAGFSTCVLSLREPCTTDEWFQGSMRVLCPSISMPVCQAVIRAEARYHKM